MMDSFLSNKSDKREQVEVDDLKRDLSSEFTILPDSQREHLQVYLRIRPFTSAESNNGESQDCVAIESPDTVLLKPPNLSLSARLSTDRSLPQTGQRFQFSQVYGPETRQRELFEGTVKDLVKDVLEGGNSLVFTYGVTNAGKTFTFLGPDADAGILPRTLDVIFSSIDEQVFPEMSLKPHRCREFTRLTREQQNEEALFKRNLFRQLKEVTSSTSSSMLGTTITAEDKISLEVEANTKFSIWVSFCEIYNENIHDLLEVVPSSAPRRTALRLSQDVKGNAFVKDLRWVQVNSAEEAYRVMKLGKKNQSFSSTRLNHFSSRSHSIFSIRILRIEDIGTPRVQTVSELCLCDLAGSERCAKTQNKGERLKEAGNINTSLLILGKCINALRHNQQAKLLQHVPFRESKLTHYLQGFFCGRGKACMIVNISQCASMYDETLNVLKFSAVAQKVVVLSSRPLPIVPQRSTSGVSFIINNAERKTLRSSRRSSLIGWESSLEDVQNDESLMDDIMDQTGNEEDSDENDDKIVICKKTHQQLQVQLKKERAETLLMEARVREEISREFSELFSEMQNDYDDRLVREREILEEQAERRLEIFKNLTDKMAKAGPSQDAQAMVTQPFFPLDHNHKTCIHCFVYLLEKTTSGKHLDDLKQKLTEQEKAAELLKAKLEKAEFKGPTSNSEAEEDLKRLNSDLQTEVASLKVKISNMEETKERSSKAAAQIPSSEMEQVLKEKDTQMEEKLAEIEKASAQKEAELQKQLLEKEAEVTSLKKSLQEAQERREEECQAVQEARRREVERRRELLAVAHEAIAQKDAELEKKAEEISRLKEEAKQDSEKVKSLGLDLQRKEDDSSDLREKLADYKKQIQQVQKEISTMREEEKSLKQKLADWEKSKKQLQSDLTNRDRTIQQLKAECDPVPLHVSVLQRVMEDMRLALTEQEETQEQMEQVLEEKLNLIQELSDDKHQAERRKWLEEKLSLIGQAKEAEDKRNHEMRKFAEDRERYTRQHSQLESQLTEKDQTMEKWRRERDTLVAALEIQLQKLVSSQAEKDKLIKELQQNITQPPLEVTDAASSLAELKAALSEREAEILRLKKDLQASTAKQEDTVTPVSVSECFCLPIFISTLRIPA
uniref:Kinesin family member 20Ba n=1 Tax=Acanthochromis polyacanthus TaxID=80966 RepID=A0A3Q1FU48_9TELE